MRNKSPFEDSLKSLKDLLFEGKDFGQIAHYFMDHLGENEDFLNASYRVANERLEAVLTQTLALYLKHPVTMRQLTLLGVPHTTFYHGSFFVDDRLGTIMYFREIDRGLIALAPGRGQAETTFVRFQCYGLYSGEGNN